MTHEERQKVIDTVKAKVETEASVSVGHVIKEVLGNAYRVDTQITESISAEIIRSEKYIRNQNDWNYYILLNPSPKRWRERYPFWHDALVATIGALLSLLVGYTLWLIDNRAKNQEKKEVNFQLEQENKRIDSLTNSPLYQKKNDDTLP